MPGNYFNWHQAIAKEKITPGVKLVLYTILNYCTWGGAYLMPSLDTLVADSGQDKETFIKNVRWAYSYGFYDITCRVMEQINEPWEQGKNNEQ